MASERWLTRHAQDQSILTTDPRPSHDAEPIYVDNSLPRVPEPVLSARLALPVEPAYMPDDLACSLGEPVSLPDEPADLPDELAHSERSLCIADAGGVFDDFPSESDLEVAPDARAAQIEPILTKLTLAHFPMPKPSRRRARAERRSIDSNDVFCADPRAQGLLYFKKWWFLRRVGISVRGTLLDGTPIFLRDDALRVINEKHSYIIPIRNVDYIRTPDGLDAACKHFECDHAPRKARGHV